MNWLISVTCGIAMVASSNGWSGKEGGGGAAIVCRDRQNKPLSAELFDLWAARHQEPCGFGKQGLEIPENHERVDVQIQRALDRIFLTEPKLSLQFAEKIFDVRQRKQIAASTPPRMHDLGHRCQRELERLPHGCQLEYIGYYNGDILYYDPNIVENQRVMNLTNQAAFWFHEGTNAVLKKQYRSFCKNSSDTREINAYSFSNLDFSDRPPNVKSNVVGNTTQQGYDVDIRNGKNLSFMVTKDGPHACSRYQIKLIASSTEGERVDVDFNKHYPAPLENHWGFSSEYQFSISPSHVTDLGPKESCYFRFFFWDNMNNLISGGVTAHMQEGPRRAFEQVYFSFKDINPMLPWTKYSRRPFKNTAGCASGN